MLFSFCQLKGKRSNAERYRSKILRKERDFYEEKNSESTVNASHRHYDRWNASYLLQGDSRGNNHGISRGDHGKEDRVDREREDREHLYWDRPLWGDRRTRLWWKSFSMVLWAAWPSLVLFLFGGGGGRCGSGVPTHTFWSLWKLMAPFSKLWSFNTFKSFRDS